MVTATLKLGLSPASGSFPFSSKTIFLDAATKLVLGSELQAADSSRKASNTNGWFAPVVSTDQAREPISPLSLSSSHAEVWSEGGKVSSLRLDVADNQLTANWHLDLYS